MVVWKERKKNVFLWTRDVTVCFYLLNIKNLHKAESLICRRGALGCLGSNLSSTTQGVIIVPTALVSVKRKQVKGFSSGCMMKSHLPRQEMRIQYLGQEDPQRRKWQFTPVFLPGKSYRQRSLAGYKSMVAKELDTTWRWNNKLTKWVTVCGALKIESVTQEAFSNFHSYIIYG